MNIRKMRMSCCHLEKVTSELEGIPGVSWRGEMVHPVHDDLELGKVGDLAPGSRIVCVCGGFIR